MAFYENLKNLGGNDTNVTRFTAPGARPDRVKAKNWLNIGYEHNGKFISLPLGMPIDTMEAADARSQNEDWVKFQTARNNLLAGLQQLGANLKPGDEVVIPNLVIKLRRIGEELVIPADTNEYVVDVMSLLTQPAAVVEDDSPFNQQAG